MSDEESDEEIVHFLGTPLDPITDDDKKEDAYSRRRPRPVPLHEQRVLDERGRPLRFHGAFTGGFSAGHFNSVADPEGRGFTPATFVSRRQRGKDPGPAPAKRARPEDFMDDEDFNEFGIAPRTFHTAIDFEDTSARTTGDVLIDMVCPIRPIKSPIAIRLMRRFGWREGQKVGALKTKSEAMTELDEDAESALLATDETIGLISFVPKTNTFGLGYSGIDPRTALFKPSASSSASATVSSAARAGREVHLGTRGQRGIRGHAFGISALEEDDDEDVYGMPNLNDYDFEIGGPPEEDEERGGRHLHGWTAPKDKRSPQKKPLGYLGKILKGFKVASSLDRSAGSRFPAPFLPAWFVPLRGANRGLLREPQDAEPAPENANEEGTPLNIPSEPGSSIFDFISREDRVRLELARKKAQGGANAGSSVSEPPALQHQSRGAGVGVLLADVRVPEKKKEKVGGARWSRWDAKPPNAAAKEEAAAPPPPVHMPQSPTIKSEPQAEPKPLVVPVTPGPSGEATPTAISTIHFRPFARDREKQARFEAFCRSPLMQQQPRDAYAPLAPAHFTEWEAQREEEEFAQASRIYRPLSSMLASRFHRGEDIHLDQTTGQIKSIPLPPGTPNAPVKVDKERSAREVAAEAKRYGKETRRTVRWYPHTLLCRRFNVPEPYPGCDIVGLEGSQPKKKDAFSIFDLMEVGNRAARAAEASAETAAIEPAPPPPPPDPKEVKRKRKSVFSCLFDDPPETSTSTANILSETSLAISSAPLAASVLDSTTCRAPAPSAQEADSSIRTCDQGLQQSTAPVVTETSQSSESVPAQQSVASTLNVGSEEVSAPSIGSDSEVKEETDLEQRIPIDIFKAIFADSEEESDEEMESEDTNKQPSETNPQQKIPPPPSKMMAASSLFRHLFEDEEEKASANVPASSSSNSATIVREDRAKEKSTRGHADPLNREKAYGAALPPSMIPAPSENLSSNEFLLRLAAGELTGKPSKKKKEKRSKNKALKKAKKSKKAKKGKRKRRTHNSSSEDSD